MDINQKIKDLHNTPPYLSFRKIGTILGISGSAAHQKYHGGAYKYTTRNMTLEEKKEFGRHKYHLHKRKKGENLKLYKPCSYCQKYINCVKS